MTRKNNGEYLVVDIALVIASIICALYLVHTDVLTRILTSSADWGFLGSFISGIFFTSVFTTAPAIAALAEISQTSNILVTATFGALGAIIGDLIIFRFVKDSLSVHMVELLEHQGKRNKFKAIFKMKSFRWVAFLASGLIIASPLPDELGITLLGFTKAKVSAFIPLSFVFNFLGILLIGLLAQTVS